MKIFKFSSLSISFVALAFAALICAPASLSAQAPLSRKKKHRIAHSQPIKGVGVHQARTVRQVVRPVRGHVITVMPRSAFRYRMANTTYFLHNGFFYRSSPRGYIVVGAPIGFQVQVLPAGFRRIVSGPHVYFYAHGTYYTYHPGRNHYEVIPASVVLAQANSYGGDYGEPYGY